MKHGTTRKPPPDVRKSLRYWGTLMLRGAQIVVIIIATTALMLASVLGMRGTMVAVDPKIGGWLFALLWLGLTGLLIGFSLSGFEKGAWRALLVVGAILIVIPFIVAARMQTWIAPMTLPLIGARFGAPTVEWPPWVIAIPVWIAGAVHVLVGCARAARRHQEARGADPEPE